MVAFILRQLGFVTKYHLADSICNLIPNAISTYRFRLWLYDHLPNIAR